MPGMRGLTVLAATGDIERFRAALTLACAQAALGGQATLFCHEGAVALLAPGADRDDARIAAAGLPVRSQLLAMARESGVRMIACQTGLALAHLAQSDLAEGVEAGGLVGVLGALGDDRLAVF